MGIELTIEELKSRIVHQLDELYLLDILGLNIGDLVDILEDRIIEEYDKIIENLDD